MLPKRVTQKLLCSLKCEQSRWPGRPVSLALTSQWIICKRLKSVQLQQCLQNVNWLQTAPIFIARHCTSNWVKWLKSCCILLCHVKRWYAWSNITEINFNAVSWQFTCKIRNGSQVVVIYLLSASNLWSITRPVGGTRVSCTSRYIKIGFSLLWKW